MGECLGSRSIRSVECPSNAASAVFSLLDGRKIEELKVSGNISDKELSVFSLQSDFVFVEVDSLFSLHHNRIYDLCNENTVARISNLFLQK